MGVVSRGTPSTGRRPRVCTEQASGKAGTGVMARAAPGRTECSLDPAALLLLS